MASLLSQLFCLSAHSRWTSLADREKLSLPPALIAPFLKSLAPNSEAGFYYLNTCHRVEVYGFAANPHAIQSAWCDATGADPSALKIFRDQAALEHFARVAAGLESEIIGENQIMGQVRTSLREGKDHNILTSSLGHILQRGLRVARNIRNESRIGEGRENLSDLAISSLHEVFETLHDKHFLVVGAGTMSLLALERLREIKATNITWINRSRDKVEAHPYARFCKIEDYSKLTDLVFKYDVVFLATGSQHPLLSKEILTAASETKSKKTSNLKVILDLGLPRNAHPDVHSLGFIVRNVDDFRSVLEDSDLLQKERIEFAEKVLRRDLDQIAQDFDLESLGPLKNEFINQWKWLGEDILLENSTNPLYNRDRFWARLGHVLMTKANELGPFDGGQFLRHLCESFQTLDAALNGARAEDSKVISLESAEAKLADKKAAKKQNEQRTP